jgi:hypothetical protein
MAGNSRSSSLTRDQFASFLQDLEQIKQFERLFATVDTICQQLRWTRLAYCGWQRQC